MVCKLHLTKDELDFLSVAVDERIKILNHFLDQENLDRPLTDAETETMKANLDRSVVVREKIRLLISYVELSQEAVKAKCRAANQKKVYQDFILKGITPNFDSGNLTIDPD